MNKKTQLQQIVVITENKAGVIARITERLAENNINIESINAVGEDGAGVVVLITDNYHAAMEALRTLPYRVIAEEVCLIRIPDQPGALAKIAHRFKVDRVNIRCMNIVQRQQKYTIVAISVSDTLAARRLLKDVLLS